MEEKPKSPFLRKFLKVLTVLFGSLFFEEKDRAVRDFQGIHPKMKTGLKSGKYVIPKLSVERFSSFHALWVRSLRFDLHRLIPVLFSSLLHYF